MKIGARETLLMTLLLLAVAGWVDALGFLRLSGIFVSFMSGDSTQFAVALARGNGAKARLTLTIVAVFLAGAATGRGLARLAGGRRQAAVLLVEAGLLSLAFVTAPRGQEPSASLGLLVFAMGLQNAAVHRAAGVKASLTYVTGTLVALGEGLADAILVRSGTERWSFAPYLLFWCALVAGAAVGALAEGAFGRGALITPIALLTGLGLWRLAGPQDPPLGRDR